MTCSSVSECTSRSQDSSSNGQRLEVDVGVLDELVAGEPLEPRRELPGAVDLEQLVRRLGRDPVLEGAVPADLGQQRRREARRAQRVAAVRAAGALPAVDRLGLLRRQPPGVDELRPQDGGVDRRARAAADDAGREGNGHRRSGEDVDVAVGVGASLALGTLVRAPALALLLVLVAPAAALRALRAVDRHDRCRSDAGRSVARASSCGLLIAVGAVPLPSAFARATRCCSSIACAPPLALAAAPPRRRGCATA